MANLAANALIDLQSVKDELGITDSSSDAALTARINRASSLVERYCGRAFMLKLVVDYVGVSPNRPPRLIVKQTPVLSVQLITEMAQTDPQVVDAANYQLEDSEAGFIFNSVRWRNTAIRQPGIVQDFDPFTTEDTTEVKYVGGYVTLVQALAASAWASGTVYAGRLLRRGSSPNEQLWLATFAGGTVSGATGGSEPSWPASPTAATYTEAGLVPGTTQADGDVTWVYLGTVGAAGLASEGTAITLPEDLRGAVLDTVVTFWRNRGQDTSITSESISGMASVSYGERGDLTEGAKRVLDRYRPLGVS